MLTDPATLRLLLNKITGFLLVLSLTAATSRADDAIAPTAAMLDPLATKTSATVNKAPPWTKGGTFVYRVCTPDNPDVLPQLTEDFEMTKGLTDGIHQIPLCNGLIGNDHKGICNWDGGWPYWGKVTFRAGSWTALHDFMQDVKDKDNTTVSFHMNLTDVNAGLGDYPEGLAFYQKMVDTKSVYRREQNPVTKKRDLPAYVPKELPKGVRARTIFAIVDYMNFYKSGLGPSTIDDFYSHLPYPPPLLYMDVLSLTGNNLNVGYPDGDLGGSYQTQLDGLLDLIAYINKKGSSIAAEGDRPLLVGKGVTYGWLHVIPGYSSNDYSYINGTSHYDALPQVAGNTGCFNLSPIATTPEKLALVRSHYANLLAGKPDSKEMPGLNTWHFADRSGIDDEWDMCPAYGDEKSIPGDAFRGDVADLINNFYLASIQELYHIGKGNVRTAIYDKSGVVHVTKFGLTDPSGKESFIGASDCAAPQELIYAKQSGYLQLEQPLEAHFTAAQAGKYKLTLYGGNPANGNCAMNVYVNGELVQSTSNIAFPSHTGFAQSYALNDITLKAGDNVIGFDAGPIYMKWSDGTTALWSTPYLRTGFKVTNGDVTFADDYDRMWPDTWSGQKKIYFFSWDGTSRTWKLPADWASVQNGTLYPLTPDGRGTGIPLTLANQSASPKLLPQIPYILVPQ